MTLEAFFKETKTQPEAFADKVGVHRYTVQRWLRRQQTPPPPIMALIFEHSGGKVTPNDLVALPKLKRSRG